MMAQQDTYRGVEQDTFTHVAQDAQTRGGEHDEHAYTHVPQDCFQTHTHTHTLSVFWCVFIEGAIERESALVCVRRGSDRKRESNHTWTVRDM